MDKSMTFSPHNFIEDNLHEKKLLSCEDHDKIEGSAIDMDDAMQFSNASFFLGTAFSDGSVCRLILTQCLKFVLKW